MAVESLLRAPLVKVGLSLCGIAAFVAVATATPVAPSGSATAGTEADLRPNVLIVITDDQPPSMMGALPRTVAWLGGQGAEYPNAVAQTPLCCPARASVLSGLYVHNHGVHTLDDAHDLDFSRTMPFRLREAGYVTAMAGKLMNAWRHTDAPPGFDRWALLGGGYTDVPIHADERTGAAAGDDGARVANQVDTMRAVATGWLDDFEKVDDRPWLLYLAPTAPHTPYGVKEGTAPAMPVTPALGEEDRSDKPPHVRDAGRGLHATEPLSARWRAAYRTLPPVDAMIDTLRQRLTDLGELENTLVVFTSDNGYQFGEHHLTGKREAYDASLRVPLYLSWPAGAPGIAGTVDRRVAGLIDLAATVYAASGVTPGYVVDGQSLLAPTTRKRILIEHFGGGSHGQNVPDWAGWWSPAAMFRENHYAGEGTSGCRDVDPETLCQRYAGLPGAAELYAGPGRLRNLLAYAAPAAGHVRWTGAAATCSGHGCWELEAQEPAVNRSGLLRVTMTAPRRLGADQAATVTVTARNIAGRQLAEVELGLPLQPAWSVTALTATRFTDVAAGATVRARFEVRFTGEGLVSLPGTATDLRSGRQAWSARTIDITRD